MGLKPNEVNSLTLSEFAMMELGFFYKQSEQKDLLRYILAYIASFGGMGLKDGKVLKPTDVFKIPILDNEDAKLPIRNRADAIKLIDLYLKGEQWQF